MAQGEHVIEPSEGAHIIDDDGAWMISCVGDDNCCVDQPVDCPVDIATCPTDLLLRITNMAVEIPLTHDCGSCSGAVHPTVEISLRKVGLFSILYNSTPITLCDTLGGLPSCSMVASIGCLNAGNFGCDGTQLDQGYYVLRVAFHLDYHNEQQQTCIVEVQFSQPAASCPPIGTWEADVDIQTDTPTINGAIGGTLADGCINWGPFNECDPGEAPATFTADLVELLNV